MFTAAVIFALQSLQFDDDHESPLPDGAGRRSPLRYLLILTGKEIPQAGCAGLTRLEVSTPRRNSRSSKPRFRPACRSAGADAVPRNHRIAETAWHWSPPFRSRGRSGRYSIPHSGAALADLWRPL